MGFGIGRWPSVIELARARREVRLTGAVFSPMRELLLFVERFSQIEPVSWKGLSDLAFTGFTFVPVRKGFDIWAFYELRSLHWAEVQAFTASGFWTDVAWVIDSRDETVNFRIVVAFIYTFLSPICSASFRRESWSQDWVDFSAQSGLRVHLDTVSGF